MAEAFFSDDNFTSYNTINLIVLPGNEIFYEFKEKASITAKEPKEVQL